jgi:hypothetical protein
MSAASDIRLLQLGAIAEGAELVAAHAVAIFDFAVDRDVAALEIALRRMVVCTNLMLGVWRDMQHVDKLATQSDSRRAA